MTGGLRRQARRALAAAPLLRLLAVASAFALGGAAARAGDLDVDPVRVDLSPRQPSAVVTVRNRASEAARYEVTVFAWDQDPDGEMKLSPTQQLVASPAELQLGPGEHRNVRVGTTGGFGAVEKSYRLLVEELSSPARSGEPAQVRVLSRVGIPVFLAPTKSETKATLDDVTVSGEHVRFALRARGTVHVRPSAVKVTGVGADGSVVFEKAGDTWYVLAGGTREYDLAIPADACARVRSVHVEVALAAGGPLRAERVVPRGACALGDAQPQ